MTPTTKNGLLTAFPSGTCIYQPTRKVTCLLQYARLTQAIMHKMKRKLQIKLWNAAFTPLA